MLRITDLVVEFAGTRVVDGVSLHIGPGETLGLVGESGCGKSAAALAILGLLPPPGRAVAGSAEFESRDLLSLDEHDLRHVRGARIGYVFQEPGAALNPSFTIGDQIAEALVVHGVTAGADARERAAGLLDAVRIPDAGRRADDFPHQLSGGMRQRAVIAAAIACRPALLIADEPTTALDATTQAELLDLLADMRRDTGMAMLLISHDLGVVAGVADRVAVMYAGHIVEEGPAARVLQCPAHPYTRGLLASLPGAKPGVRLASIPGTVPEAGAWPPGCRFAPRCADRREGCDTAIPDLRRAEPGHRARCVLLGDAN